MRILFLSLIALLSSLCVSNSYASVFSDANRTAKRMLEDAIERTASDNDRSDFKKILATLKRTPKLRHLDFLNGCSVDENYKKFANAITEDEAIGNLTVIWICKAFFRKPHDTRMRAQILIHEAAHASNLYNGGSECGADWYVVKVAEFSPLSTGLAYTPYARGGWCTHPVRWAETGEDLQRRLCEPGEKEDFKSRKVRIFLGTDNCGSNP